MLRSLSLALKKNPHFHTRNTLGFVSAMALAITGCDTPTATPTNGTDLVEKDGSDIAIALEQQRIEQEKQVQDQFGQQKANQLTLDTAKVNTSSAERIQAGAQAAQVASSRNQAEAQKVSARESAGAQRWGALAALGGNVFSSMSNSSAMKYQADANKDVGLEQAAAMKKQAEGAELTAWASVVSALGGSDGIERTRQQLEQQLRNEESKLSALETQHTKNIATLTTGKPESDALNDEVRSLTEQHNAAMAPIRTSIASARDNISAIDASTPDGVIASKDFIQKARADIKAAKDALRAISSAPAPEPDPAANNAGNQELFVCANGDCDPNQPNAAATLNFFTAAVRVSKVKAILTRNNVTDYQNDPDYQLAIADLDKAFDSLKGRLPAQAPGANDPSYPEYQRVQRTITLAEKLKADEAFRDQFSQNTSADIGGTPPRQMTAAEAKAAASNIQQRVAAKADGSLQISYNVTDNNPIDYIRSRSIGGEEIKPMAVAMGVSSDANPLTARQLNMGGPAKCQFPGDPACT